jgi:hypothetical protein
MKNRTRAWAVVAGISLSFGLAFPAYTQSRSPRLIESPRLDSPSTWEPFLPGTLGAPFQDSGAAKKEAVVTAHASGTFEVKVTPENSEGKTESATFGRMSIDKQFHGDLEGTSKGEMLTAGTEVKGSAGYVALEKVSGTLQGRSGTFMLQHGGTMTRGVPQLTITVVPDSGTGQLAGLAGKMTIKIADGKHSYDFEYTLTEAH